MAFKKNTAVTGFPFALVSATDGSAITSGTVTGKYLLDGGAQGTISGTPVHEGNGQWSVNLTAAEMNGDIVGLLFIHASAVPVHFTTKTVLMLVSDLNDITTAAVDSVLADDFAAIPAAVDSVLSGDFAAIPAAVDSVLADDFAAIPAAVDSVLSGDFAAIPAAVEAVQSSVHGGGSWETGAGAMGTGADLCTITVETIGGAPFPDADVWITSDAPGTTVVAGTLQTNSNGEVQFMLDDQATYYLWAQKDGMNSILGQQFVAVKD